MDDYEVYRREMMIKEWGELCDIKCSNICEELGHLVTCYLKLLNNDPIGFYVESISIVYLQHHPFRMHI
jgi:hypothetical protein